jgi:hypothetical protein
VRQRAVQNLQRPTNAGEMVSAAQTGLRERADDTASHPARRGAGKRGHQPAGGDHGTDSWNGHQPEPSEQTCGTAHRRANSGARAGGLGTIILAVEIAIRERIFVRLAIG